MSGCPGVRQRFPYAATMQAPSSGQQWHDIVSPESGNAGGGICGKERQPPGSSSMNSQSLSVPKPISPALPVVLVVQIRLPR
mmetsp:Transcript_7068/g.7682  ORF Transcript_7068/g.7682 Transcript_7068/m.7682 type:complete len:82 (-) Transcript_7068:20-265(-)